MKKSRMYLIRLLVTSAAILAFVLLFQSRASSGRDSAAPVHMLVDWSNRHLIYSGQPTGPHAWEAMQDPRYQRHLSIYANQERMEEERWGSGGWFDRRWHWPLRRREESPLKRDWQVDLGPNALTGNVNGDYTFPAKFTFDINAMPSCPKDFVVVPTGLVGTAGQASIAAINQLYSGSGGFCGTGQPSVMWAYNTNLAGDTNGLIYSSPVLSGDGAKVAFVENGNGAAILKILKWVSGQGTVSAAITPTPIITGNPWSTCPTIGTSCLFSLTFSGGASDTYSSPFYRYDNDSLYIGDDNGKLHKFTGVFNGTPTEATTGGWPFTIPSGNPLTGPVYDAVSGNIFVADLYSSLHYVRETGSMIGSCSAGSPPCIGTPSLTVSDVTAMEGVFDPPTVDQATQKVFVFTSGDPSVDNAAVFQATTALGSPIETVLQSGFDFIFSGAFDKHYHAGSYASGFLYVCGTNPTTLYRIGFNSLGVMNSSTAAGSVNLESDGLGSSCSPITEILNGPNDYLFFGMFQDGNFTGCSTGCALSLNLTTMTWPPALSAFSSLPVVGGPSAIVVDNVGSGGQESSIYFGPQGNNCASPAGSGCAVKATQSGLN